MFSLSNIVTINMSSDWIKEEWRRGKGHICIGFKVVSSEHLWLSNHWLELIKSYKSKVNYEMQSILGYA